MWENAEVVGLLDEDGVVRAVSRNESEALVRHVLGRRPLTWVTEAHRGPAAAAIEAAQRGEEVELVIAALADDGAEFWNRVRLLPAPENEGWVLVHARRLPTAWATLSQREKEVVRVLHEVGLNPKRAARELGVSINTINAHRRSITQKCGLNGPGDFWVFVERCR